MLITFVDSKYFFLFSIVEICRDCRRNFDFRQINQPFWASIDLSREDWIHSISYGFLSFCSIWQNHSHWKASKSLRRRPKDPHFIYEYRERQFNSFRFGKSFGFEWLLGTQIDRTWRHNSLSLRIIGGKRVSFDEFYNRAAIRKLILLLSALANKFQNTYSQMVPSFVWVCSR